MDEQRGRDAEYRAELPGDTGHITEMAFDRRGGAHQISGNLIASEARADKPAYRGDEWTLHIVGFISQLLCLQDRPHFDSSGAVMGFVIHTAKIQDIQRKRK